jgi:PAS domain S-box-containing protein
MPEALATKFARSLDEAFEAGEPHTLEFSVATAGGERLFEAYHIPERDAAGNISTVLCVAHDITERKRAENALRESQKQFHAVTETAYDGIVSADEMGNIVYFNQAAARIFGYSLAEVIGQPLTRLMPTRFHAAHKAGLQRFLSGQPPSAIGKTLEFVGRRKDGTEFPLELSLATWREGAGVFFTGILRDITERKRAGDALRESEERFRQLAENIRQVFWIATLPLDKVIYISPAYEEIWGRSRDSLYRNPRSWMDSTHPEDLPRVRAAAEGMARGRPLDVEYRIIRQDGTLRWIRDRSYPMKAGDGTPLACGIAEDITDLKLAEQEKLTHAIHQRDALVREVHHRIKNSLQGVVGLLRQKIRKYPAVAPDIEEAIGQLQSLALVYGLQETRPDGLLSLAEITDAICSSAEKLTGGRVNRTFERRSQRQACIAGAEAVSVAVALNELVLNALKHQPAQAGKKHATVKLSEAHGAAEIRIANRGHLPESFDFATGRAMGHGLGLVRTLLAPPGGKIAFNGGRNKVEVTLTLAPPLLAERSKAYAK